MMLVVRSARRAVQRFRVPTPPTRLLATTTQATPTATTGDVDGFVNDFLATVVDKVPHATDPARSAALLREVVKSRVLKLTDMQHDPKKFFLAHRLLSTVGLSGFGIRFTVMYNLFAGSILGLGGPEQVALLDVMQERGQLGCFLLTERQAGVLSGLIVETTVEYDEKTKEFVLHTPSEKAAKNWISQGYTAELGVVIARLVVKGVDHGPHPLLMRMRDDNGKLMKGITIKDMGTKTVANDLDNARVWFDRVRLPRTALLNKFADVTEHGEYVQMTDERMRIEVIGQRLLTGRLCIAQAALVFARTLHMRAETYAKEKICNGLEGETTLREMPQLNHVFETSYGKLDDLIAYSAAVEDDLNKHLIAGTIPDDDLVDAISVAKIKCIDAALESVFNLRREVGSFALMHDTGFALGDMLLCTKFAEGDSRILQQKLTRDRLKRLGKGGIATALATAVNPLAADRAEVALALSLARKLGQAGRDRVKLGRAMNENWTQIYELADMCADRIVREYPRGRFPEAMVERFVKGATTFDHDWKDKI